MPSSITSLGVATPISFMVDFPLLGTPLHPSQGNEILNAIEKAVNSVYSGAYPAEVHKAIEKELRKLHSFRKTFLGDAEKAHAAAQSVARQALDKLNAERAKLGLHAKVGVH